VFEIHSSTVANPNTFVKMTYDGVSTLFSLPNAVDTIAAGQIYYFKV